MLGGGHRKKPLRFRVVFFIPLQHVFRRDAGPDRFKGGGAMAGQKVAENIIQLHFFFIKRMSNEEFL